MSEFDDDIVQQTLKVDVLVGNDNVPAQLMKLHEMFNMQRILCERCFSEMGMTDNQGGALTLSTIAQETADGKHGANDLPVRFIRDFTNCIRKECDEIEEILPWKHWSREQIGEKAYPDLKPEERMNMLRIEIIDIWHFLMNLLMVCGMGPDDLYAMYVSKNKVNFERQKNEYNTASKTEDDNLKIATGKE